MQNITLYLDESGKYSLKSNEQEPFILTGVIIEKKDVNAIEGFFKYIKLKYEIPTTSPFHSFDIYESFTKKHSDTDLKNLSCNLADFISLIPIKIKILQINKKVFKKALGIKSNKDFQGSWRRNKMVDFPYKIMFTYFLGWFTKYIKDDYIGSITIDSRRGADKNLIDALDQSIDPTSDYEEKVKKIIKNKCTALCFANKSFLSGALELTDFISYTSFFKSRRMLSQVKKWGFIKVWNAIKTKIDDSKITLITEKNIVKFFKIKDVVHKFLKDS